MIARADRHLTPRQYQALLFLRLVERTNLATLRRRAVQEMADRALEDPDIAEAVDNALEYQIRRAVELLTEDGAS